MEVLRSTLRTVYLLSSVKDKFLFEEIHWWITQTARLADQWLDSLFGDRRTYAVDDWVALYHTDLNILGLRVDNNVQECAVLCRLIYGLSAAFLIVGEDRFGQAAVCGALPARRLQKLESRWHILFLGFWAYEGVIWHPTARSIPERQQHQDQISSMSRVIRLTGLANSTHFPDRKC